MMIQVLLCSANKYVCNIHIEPHSLGYFSENQHRTGKTFNWVKINSVGVKTSRAEAARFQTNLKLGDFLSEASERLVLDVLRQRSTCTHKANKEIFCGAQLNC
jgi:hypothetical protein